MGPLHGRERKYSKLEGEEGKRESRKRGGTLSPILFFTFNHCYKCLYLLTSPFGEITAGEPGELKVSKSSSLWELLNQNVLQAGCHSH